MEIKGFFFIQQFITCIQPLGYDEGAHPRVATRQDYPTSGPPVPAPYLRTWPDTLQKNYRETPPPKILPKSVGGKFQTHAGGKSISTVHLVSQTCVGKNFNSLHLRTSFILYGLCFWLDPSFCGLTVLKSFLPILSSPISPPDFVYMTKEEAVFPCPCSLTNHLIPIISTTSLSSLIGL